MSKLQFKSSTAKVNRKSNRGQNFNVNNPNSNSQTLKNFSNAGTFSFTFPKSNDRNDESNNKNDGMQIEEFVFVIFICFHSAPLDFCCKTVNYNSFFFY
jgi:hypothetical protein